MLDLISIFAAAAIAGVLVSLLGQPVLLGYLIAGLIIGPFGLNLIQEYDQVQIVAELGVTFLLFTLGVEFSFSELQKVKNIAIGGGGLQIILTIGITLILSLTVGLVTTIPEGILLGELITLSSTAVVLKILIERNEIATLHGQVMLGILIVQDLALGLILAIMPALNKPVEEISIAVGIALVKILIFGLVAVAIGKWIIPRILRLLAKTESKELFLLGVVAICLGIALVTGALGLSTEMGAFVAGLMISEVEYSDQTLAYVEPIRDICVAAFFVSIGILINPIFLWQNLPVILALVTFVLVAKTVIITPLVLLFRYPLKSAIIAGLGLAQIGEFSFVLAKEGKKYALISENLYLLILGATAVTLALTPFIFRGIPIIFAGAKAIPGIRDLLAKADVPLDVAENLPYQNHIIVCGYGQVGSNIVKLFQERNYPVLVIDESEQRIQQLREAKIPYIYGNPASEAVLEKAQISAARGMAITLPDSMSTRLCLKRSLAFNPELDLVVRANDEEDIELLYQMGAKEVVQPEFEASLELSTHLFIGLGFPATGVQQNIQQIRQSRYASLRGDRSLAEIAQELQAATRTMGSKWYPLPDDSPLIGKTLEKAYLRRLTGATLIAIIRSNQEKIDYPTSETMINQGDNLLLVGDSDELAAFEQLAQGKVKILPQDNDSSLLVLVPENSLIIGKTLKELKIDERFGVSIQGIRRSGKYIRFPDGDNQIKAKDQLLVFGQLNKITGFTQFISEVNSEKRE